MAQRKVILAALVFALVGVVVYANTPPALVTAAVAPHLPDDIDAWLADREQQVASQYALIPGTEKRVSWYGQRRSAGLRVTSVTSSSMEILA